MFVRYTHRVPSVRSMVERFCHDLTKTQLVKCYLILRPAHRPPDFSLQIGPTLWTLSHLILAHLKGLPGPVCGHFCIVAKEYTGLRSSQRWPRFGTTTMMMGSRAGLLSLQCWRAAPPGPSCTMTGPSVTRLASCDGVSLWPLTPVSTQGLSGVCPLGPSGTLLVP